MQVPDTVRDKVQVVNRKVAAFETTGLMEIEKCCSHQHGCMYLTGHVIKNERARTGQHLF